LWENLHEASTLYTSPSKIRHDFWVENSESYILDQPNIKHTSLQLHFGWEKNEKALCQTSAKRRFNAHSFLEHPNEEAPMLLEDLLEVQIQSSTAPYPGSGTEPNLTYQDPQKPKTFSGIITLGVPCTYLNNAFFLWANHSKILIQICFVSFPHIWVI